jgi:hypothetical protein
MNLLSVDWDYFFPDTMPYDWGHKEEDIFLEFLWSARASARHLITHEYAVDVFHPDGKRLEGFWERVNPLTSPKQPWMLVIADSHMDIMKILEIYGKGVNVVNFDAHHDLYYGEELPKEIDCSCWAGHGLQRGIISSYTLVYPPWKEDDKLWEGIPDEFKHPTTRRMWVLNEVPAALPPFDIIFICRSSAWTPSWADGVWLDFVGYWEFRNPFLWNSRATCDFVKRVRHPNLKEAFKLRDKFVKEFEKFLKGTKNT